jgi:hypothetical protein
MQWIVFSASLPSKTSSSPRVTLWRRLQRLGAVAPVGGVYVLPTQEVTVEAFQWLAQEIHQAQGEALVMHVERFEGLSDAQMIALFQAARREEYAKLESHLQALETTAMATPLADDQGELREALEKLRRRHAEIQRIDYFASPEGGQFATRLARIAQTLASQDATAAEVPHVDRATYRARRWVTRPRPHVDRLACAWLLRRFIDSAAPIRYADDPAPDEVAFDVEGAHFGHNGQLCSFETMLRAFALDDPALRAIAEIVHEIDLRDGHYTRPELPGIDAILAGWQQTELADADRETYGLALFDGLYAAFRK